MKRKIKLLIIASILGLVALSITQAYLINNTYKLKKDVFITETRRSISNIDDFTPALDSLSEIWQERFLNTVTNYKINKATKADIIDNLQFIIDSINPTYKAEYQKALIDNNIPYGIKFHKKIRSIVLLDSIQNDTIFNIEKSPKEIVLGNSIKEKDAITISSMRWQTDHTSDRIINGETKEIFFYLVLQTHDQIDIEGWKRILLKQMFGLLSLSLIIFSVVIGLLYYSIKSLITQKKIADIKTDFVNNITHELKTPLATLSLATKMLKNTDVKQQPKLLDNTVSTIERQNKRLQKLIDQVMDNSLGYKDIVLHKESVNIESYVNSVLDDFMLSVKSKKITLKRSALVLKDTIKIDKFYITTAIFNILENAVKYSQDTVDITCNIKCDENLIITIEDNGIGMSQEHLKQIFDKFFRAGNKEIHDVKGLGLGLYYTNQIIKAHDGKIEVKSKEGKGSTFIINIPNS